MKALLALGRQMAALALLIATPAVAQVGKLPTATALPTPVKTVCLATTAANCTDPAYFKTTCGAQALASQKNNKTWICNQIWQQNHQGFTAQKGVSEKPALVPETVSIGNAATTQPGIELRPTYVKPYDSTTDLQTQDFACGANRYKAAPGSKPASTTGSSLGAGPTVSATCASPTGVNTSLGNVAWNLNGTAVASCDEYAWEKLYEMSLAMDQMKSRRGDARYFVDMVLNPASAYYLGGNNTISSRSGNSQTTVPFLSCAPSNAFAEYLAATGQLAPTCAPETWAWHAQKNAVMKAAGHPDDVLEYLRDKQGDFMALRARKDQLEMERLQDVQALAGAFGPAKQAAAQLEWNQNLVAENFLHEQILDALEVAELELGCVPSAPGQLTPCDWAPSALYDRMLAFYDSAYMDYRNKCMRATGGQLTNLEAHFRDPKVPGATVGPMGGPVKSSAYFTASTERLDEFFANKAAHTTWYLAQLKSTLPVDPSTGKVETSESKLSEESMGNSMFGLANRVAALSGLDFESSVDLCKNGVFVDAGVSAVAGILGFKTEIMDARLTVKDGNAHAHARVMGQDLFTPIDAPTAASFAIVDEHEKWEDSLELFSITFPVFGIPLSLKAGVYGRAALDVDADLVLGAQVVGKATPTPCRASVGVEATVLPSLDVGAYVSVSVDLLIIEIGIKGELSLIRLELPLSASVALALQLGPTGQVDLLFDPQLSADWSLSTLSGRVSLFAEINLFFTKLREEVTLVQWRGPEKSGTLFDLDYPMSVPLSAIFAINGM